MTPWLISKTKASEDFRAMPYLDCCGKPWRQCVCETKGYLTIGYGRNLDVNGIRRSEGDVMVENDLADAISDVKDRLPWSEGLSDARKDALYELAFNMGIGTLLHANPKMLSALHDGAFSEAAAELMDGPWHEAVGPVRSQRIKSQIETGTYPA